jgi:hypothetical protein
MADQSPQIPVPHGYPFTDFTQPAAVETPGPAEGPGPLDAAHQTTATGPSTPVAEDTPTAAGAAASLDPVARCSRRRGPVVLAALAELAGGGIGGAVVTSGGPLVDSAGQVVGMDTAAASSEETGTSAQNIGFAIPSRQIVAEIAVLQQSATTA